MGDPIEDLRRACELIRQSTGEAPPRHILIGAATWDRIKAMVDERRARRRPGIDS